MILDADLGARQYIQSLVTGHFEVVGTASDSEEGLRLAKECKPDIILADIDLPQTGGIEFTRTLTQALPLTAIVLLSARQEMALVRQAMTVGARDFLKRPIDPEELLAALRRVAGQLASKRRLLRDTDLPPGAGIWAFTSPCGGVGQTTLLLSMAYEIVSRGHSVVVVDLDLAFGCVAFYLGLHPQSPNLSGLVYRDHTNNEIVEQHLKLHENGIKALVGPAEVLSGHGIQPSRVVPAVLGLERFYDYVLLDLPQGLPEGYVDLLDAARYLMVPASWTIGSMKKIRQYLHVLMQLDYEADRVHPLISGDPEDNAMIEQFRLLVETAGAHRPFHFPRARSVAEDAILAGEPASQKFPDSMYARTVREFLDRLLGSDKKGVHPGRRTIFHRIFGKG